MADHPQPIESPISSAPLSRNDPDTTTRDLGGLASLRGIRWLLLAGALVTAVSLYRLVESQWELIPVAGQYLVVVLGALGLYAVGELAYRRLRLPLVGSALLALFAVLVPVLSWGAVYLDLLAEPVGWIAFSFGTAGLLVAARRPLVLILGYQGLLYPAILAVFMVAQAVLPELVRRVPDLAGTIYLAAAVLLGALLQLGSRHINRFFFHRDRMDGVERPVQWMPFAVLGILYLGAMILLDPRSEFMALPLAIIGMVLADTGEEYYRALIGARGEKPERWPRRSVALMALGIAAMAVALPLSFADPTLRCSAVVSICAAVFFGRWSLRSPGLASHLAALGSVFAAYHFFPALVPGLAKELWARLLVALDLSHGSPLAISIADLGFLLILIAWSGLLRRNSVPDGLRAIHAGIAVVYLWWLSVLALVDPADPSLFLLVLAIVGMIGLVVSRRQELVIGVSGTIAGLVLAFAQHLLGEPQLLTGATLSVLGVATLISTLVIRWVEAPVILLLGIKRGIARRCLLLPTIVIAALIAIHGLFVDLLINDVGSLELVLAGGLFFASGIGLWNRFLPALGSVLVTVGLHVMVYDLSHEVAPLVVLMTQALAVLSLWAVVAVSSATGRFAVLLRPTVFLMAVVHCVLGLWWLLLAAARWNLTVEPIILAILGLLAADVSLTTRRRINVVVGGLLLMLFVHLQFIAAVGLDDWAFAIPASLVAVGLLLLLSIITVRPAGREILRRHYRLDANEFIHLVVRSIQDLVQVWLAVSIGTCLLYCGQWALILAVVMVGVVTLARYELQSGLSLREAFPLRLSLVLALQLVMATAGGSHPVLPLALVIHGFDLLPLMAAAVLGWRLLGHLLGRQRRLTAWSVAVELALALIIVAAAIGAPVLPLLSNIVIVAVAIALAGLRVASGATDPRALHSWMAQIWIGFAVLHGFTAGWLQIDGAAAPWLLLVVGIAEYGLAIALARTSLGPVFGPACRRLGLGLPLIAWTVAMLRVVGHDGTSAWLAALPAFAVSLFCAVIALREERTAGSSLAAAITFGWTLLAVVVQSGLGFEYTFLAPGLTLMALAYLLRPRVGPTWSSYLATAGAACLYATPIVALSEQVSWVWLAVLLVMAVVIGSACIALRSRSLLVVSTAAMLTDLGFFVFKIGTTEPLLLWVFGLAFGLGLMAWAGYLEYQREGLLQQVRVFGRELKSWN